MKKTIYLIAFFLTTHKLFAQPALSMQTIASGFNSPVCITNAGDSRLFVVEQDGIINIIHEDGTITEFMDINSIVGSSGSEQGLLGLTFHPDYADNGYFYVNYTNNSGNTRISRFSVDAVNPDLGNPASELNLKTITQPYSNHNGGDLCFGPDGYLYIGMGDGGSGGDPGNRAQDTTSQLLGKMLRLDVNTTSPYIPASNPYVGISGDDEIWAYGLRNPWRFSFDRLTGDMWIGDVGQGEWEEVDFQPASSTGAINYGWRCYEGNHEYNMATCGGLSNYTFPVFEYDHSFDAGGYAITGGYVYRGSEFAGMYGYYITCDYVTGNFWTLYPDGTGGWIDEFYPALQSDVSSFGEGVDGELYACNLSSGEIYHIVDENCGAVWGITETGITSTSATISWQDVGSPNYKFSYKAPGGSWINSSSPSTIKVLTGLSPSTTYTYRIRNKCAGIPGQFSKVGSFKTNVLKSTKDESNSLFAENQSSGIFHFIYEADNINLQIIDLQGRKIYSETIHAGDEVNLQHLASGMYIASCYMNGNVIVSQKIILSK